jgi:hypothetical protein
MTGDFEALGDAVTGAALAGVLEPQASGPTAQLAQGPDRETAPCLNCGSALLGNHCHSCGQKAKVHRTLGAFWHDFLHSIFHFEGKVWRTVPLLFLKPGELTRRYVHGERAKFVSPLALFLFSVFLMFATFSLGGDPIADVNPAEQQVASAKRAEIAQELKKVQQELGQLKQAGNPQAAAAIGALESRIAKLQVADTLAEGVQTSKVRIEMGGFDSGSKWLNQRVKHALENQELLLYRLQSSAYKYSWLLILMSVPLMWLLFPFRRDLRMFDHAVFVTYSIAFVSLLLVVMALLALVGLESDWMLLAVPIHMFLQLKHAYGLTIRSALWRTCALMAIAGLVFAVFAVLLLALGVMG